MTAMNCGRVCCSGSDRSKGGPRCNYLQVMVTELHFLLDDAKQETCAKDFTGLKFHRVRNCCDASQTQGPCRQQKDTRTWPQTSSFGGNYTQTIGAKYTTSSGMIICVMRKVATLTLQKYELPREEETLPSFLKGKICELSLQDFLNLWIRAWSLPTLATVACSLMSLCIRTALIIEDIHVITILLTSCVRQWKTSKLRRYQMISNWRCLHAPLLIGVQT